MNKEGKYYFDNFKACSGIALEEARMLESLLRSFTPEILPETMAAMHEIEHRGDIVKHEMIEKLLKAFITPIERNDIFRLSHAIDNLTDDIEEIGIKLYMTGVKTIRPETDALVSVLIRCCEAVHEMLGEFENFRKSKTLKELIQKINRVEEEGDALYIRVMHQLYQEKHDPLTILIWGPIFSLFEDCCDTCENIANIIEGIMIDNL